MILSLILFIVLILSITGFFKYYDQNENQKGNYPAEEYKPKNIDTPPKNTPEDNQTSTCTDSDGGLNYDVKGYVKGYWEVNGKMESYNLPDGCHNSSDIVENYCEGNNARSTWMVNCPNGCEDGACIEDNQVGNTDSPWQPSKHQTTESKKPVITNGLISYWKFDNDTYDYWGNNDGIAYGKAEITTRGKPSGAIRFDGNSYSGLDVGIMDSKLVGLSSITTSAWIYPERFGTDNSYREIIITNTVDDNGILEWRLGGNSFLWSISSTGGEGGGGQFATDLLKLNQWQHVAVTWDGTTINGYLNGQKLSEVYNSTGTLFRGYNYCDPCTSIPLNIGSRGLGERHISWYPNSFLGSIDEVSIYKRALSEEEIKQIYESVN